MRLSVRYGSHLLVLLQAVFRTYGPILELGMGTFSTRLLHDICTLEKRQLVSCESDSRMRTWAYRFRSKFHLVHYLSDWDQAPIDVPWDVALIDHSPSERRITEIRRLANLAQYLVVHDTDRGFEAKYHYREVFKEFKHSLTWTAVSPHTMVLSNFRSLDNFWERTWPRTVEFK